MDYTANRFQVSTRLGHKCTGWANAVRMPRLMMYAVSVLMTPSVLGKTVGLRQSIQAGIRFGKGHRLKPVIFLRNAHDSAMQIHTSAIAAAQTLMADGNCVFG